MRSNRVLRVLLALALVPAPALADVTARYQMGETVFTVGVDTDTGMAFATSGAQFTLIRRDGVDYAVMPVGGRTIVVEFAGIMARFRQRIEALRAENPLFSGPGQSFRWERIGPATVGGRPGTAYRLRGDRDPDGADDPGNRLTIADDPALLPVGAIFATILEQAGAFLMPGLAENNLAAAFAELLRRGAPLAMGPAIRLVSVETDEIDARHFVLPASVMPVDAAFAAIEAARGEPGAPDSARPELRSP